MKQYGKLDPIHPEGLHFLDEYFTSPLAAPPSSVNAPGIPVDGWGMLGNGPDPSCTFTGDGFNNEVGCGDCTKAGEAHFYDALTWDEGLGENKNHPLSTAVVAAYFAETGGVDSGLACQSVLQQAFTVGAYGQKIGGYGPIQYTDQTLLKQLIASFGAAYIGIQCPESAEQDYDAGKPWSVVAGSKIVGGHCIILVGYDDATSLYQAVSWGKLVDVTYQFIATYMDEAWGALAPAIATKGEFDKIDFAALQADLAAIAPNDTIVAQGGFINDVEHILDEVKDAIESVPSHIKNTLKHAHKLEEAVAEGVSVAVIESIIKDLLKAYVSKSL